MRIADTLPPLPATPPADRARVAEILADVQARGDQALAHWTRLLDRHMAPAWTVPKERCKQAWDHLPEADRAAIKHAAKNVRAFAAAQLRHCKAWELKITPGVAAAERVVPVRRAACYVPAGRHPLPSTVLMTALPAVVAGVRDVAVFTPPGPDGWPHDAILAACFFCGVQRVHPVGGVQAIGAAAFGTASVAPVDLVVGPGNRWVTEAKRQVVGTVGIDMLAGPSEVLVVCDAAADVQAVAADLLAQAEHDPDAQALVVTTDTAVAEKVAAEVAKQLAELPPGSAAHTSIERHGCIAVFADRPAALLAVNARAPEHLELHVADPGAWVPHLHDYGALFVGRDAAEVLGDYCMGPSHVLPTGRAGRWQGGLSVRTFLKFLATQRVEPGRARALAQTAARLARIEGLEAHARAAELRGRQG
jgi:histidinol dehydrogenase